MPSEHLPRERNASLHTSEAYASSFKLLVCFAATQLHVKPCQVEIEQLDVSLILTFLQHLESERGNSARTRNARLAAIHSFFRFLDHLNQAGIAVFRPCRHSTRRLVRIASPQHGPKCLCQPPLRKVGSLLRFDFPQRQIT